LEHPPQLFESVIVSTQALPQPVRPPAQVIAHELPLQLALPVPLPVVGPGQFVPQALPQLFGSVFEAQDEPQMCVPLGHWQAPPLVTLAQTCPLALQLAHDAPLLPHDPADSFPNVSHVVPLLQQPLQPLVVLHTQLPLEQVVPVPHGLLHLPQLLLSSRLLHVVPQSVWFAAQPLVHPNVTPNGEQLGADAGQTIPHAPQLWAFERSTVHPVDPLPEQYVQPAWQDDLGTLHAPVLHVALPVTWGSAVQSFPHDPQLYSSPRQPTLHA
jgi:hypothetical protein